MSAAKLQSYAPVTKQDKTIPFLTALLEFAPNLEARSNVDLEITSCKDDDALRQLRDMYVNGLIIPIRAHGGRTPAISDHPSRPSVELNEELRYLIETARRDQSILKRSTLVRNNYRCMVSENVDYTSFKENRVSDVSPETEVETTAAVHIIPFSIVPKDETPTTVCHKNFGSPFHLAMASPDKFEMDTSEILRRFGGIQLHELNGENINRCENVMTLSGRLHKPFGDLDIWLDAIDGQLHTYRFRKAFPRAATIPEGTVIRFSSTDPRLPLPDPRYIALHAACANVCHASGAAEIIDKVFEGI